MPADTPVLYGPEMTFVSEPGVTLEGMVKDAAVGEAGARTAASGSSFRVRRRRGRPGRDGRFKITGVPKNRDGYSLWAGFDKGTSAYLSRRLNVPDPEGLNARADVDLHKGAVVTGRVIDKQTGKGVLAGVRFAPLPDNKFFGSKPGFDNYLSDRTMESTDDDGRFRLVTIPGRALVLVQAHGRQAQRRTPQPVPPGDPDEKDRDDCFEYDKAENSYTITTAGGSEFLGVENAVKVIDVKEDGETEVELTLDRGVTATLAVQDADGQPLAGGVGGRRDRALADHLQAPRADHDGLRPRPRQAADAGGVPRGEEVGRHGHGPRRREGAGRCEARPARDGEGPAARRRRRRRSPGADVGERPGSGQRAVPVRPPAAGEAVVTDKEGRFTLPGVVPGVKFYLQIQKGNEYFGGKPKIGLREVKAGETLDLGDRTLELLR